MTINITLKEVFAIENLISAEHTSNNYYLPSWETPYKDAFAGETWSDCADHGGGKNGEKTTGKAFAGVCSSLVQKGWAFVVGSGRDSAIGVTEAGWKAYQEWARENLADEKKTCKYCDSTNFRESHPCPDCLERLQMISCDVCGRWISTYDKDECSIEIYEATGVAICPEHGKKVSDYK